MTVGELITLLQQQFDLNDQVKIRVDCAWGYGICDLTEDLFEFDTREDAVVIDTL